MLYDMLKILVSVFFNALNKIMRGNLPPFGSAAVIVEWEERFLVIELPRGRLAFPGGFMRWREQPHEAARREGKEETGLDLETEDLVNVYTQTTTNWLAMSSIAFVYSARVLGGKLRRNVEGRPCWLPESELRRRFDGHTQRILDDYLRYRSGKMQPTHLRRVS